eukprot:5631975-Prymnesium_polylepis.1
MRVLLLQRLDPPAKQFLEVGAGQLAWRVVPRVQCERHHIAAVNAQPMILGRSRGEHFGVVPDTIFVSH